MTDVGRVPAPRWWRRTPALSGKPGRDPHRISVWLAALMSPCVVCSNGCETRAAFCRMETVGRRSARLEPATQSRCTNADRAGSYAVESSGSNGSLSAVLRPGSRWLLVLSTAGSSRLATTAGEVRSGRFRRDASDAATCFRRFICETDDIPTLSGRLRVVFRPRGLSQLPRNM